MNTWKQLGLAIHIATEAHANQFDKIFLHATIFN